MPAIKTLLDGQLPERRLRGSRSIHRSICSSHRSAFPQTASRYSRVPIKNFGTATRHAVGYLAVKSGSSTSIHPSTNGTLTSEKVARHGLVYDGYARRGPMISVREVATSEQPLADRI